MRYVLTEDSFDAWNNVKKEVEKNDRKLGIKPREIFWTKIGQNVGDGQTDIPAFALVNKKGGKSIAVYREEKNPDGSIDEARTLKSYLNGYKLAVEAKRSEQLLPADYSSGKPLKMALLGYVESIATHIVSRL